MFCFRLNVLLLYAFQACPPLSHRQKPLPFLLVQVLFDRNRRLLPDWPWLRNRDILKRGSAYRLLVWSHMLFNLSRCRLEHFKCNRCFGPCLRELITDLHRAIFPAQNAKLYMTHIKHPLLACDCYLTWTFILLITTAATIVEINVIRFCWVGLIKVY